MEIRGIVETQHDKEKIQRIAKHHAGDAFSVVNDVEVKLRNDS